MSKAGALSRFWNTASKFNRIHPLLSTLGRAGAGAGVGYVVAPEDKKLQGLQYGALGGAATGLLSKGIRGEAAKALKRQVHGATGYIPGKGFKPTTKDFMDIQKAKTLEGSMLRPAKKKWLVEGSQAAAKKSRDQLKRMHEAGLTSVPGMYRAIKKRGLKQFGKDWWKEMGWSGAAMPVAFTAMGAQPHVAGATSDNPMKRRQSKAQIGQEIGSGLGWLASGPLPMSVWMPASAAFGYLGKKVAGG